MVAMADREVQALRQVPRPHEPAADFRMIGLQTLHLNFGKRDVIALQGFAAAIKIGTALSKARIPTSCSRAARKISSAIV